MEVARPGCGYPELGEPDWSERKNKISLMAEYRYSDSYADALNQEGVVRLTGKFDSELVIVDIESAGDNCSSNNGGRRSEAPFSVAIDDAQARRPPKIRAAGGPLVQWTRRGKCK